MQDTSSAQAPPPDDSRTVSHVAHAHNTDTEQIIPDGRIHKRTRSPQTPMSALYRVALRWPLVVEALILGEHPICGLHPVRPLGQETRDQRFLSEDNEEHASVVGAIPQRGRAAGWRSWSL